MKTFIRGGLVVAGLLAGAGVSPASAQVDVPLKFKTTFPFMVGTKLLPAGSYTVGPAGDDLSVLEIRGDKGSAMLSTMNASVPRTDPKHSEVIFDRSGDRYVLTEVWDESSRQGAERIPSKAERQPAAEHAQTK